ncbi:hypothetical protein FACS189450_11650 [Spirochaetia bacterium]|nr:hypothetical protein FACS189450_11650 [Spirochaetia bacterium]
MADIVYKDKFIWDAAKNELNKEKHPGISFELATGVFDDPYAVEIYDGGPKVRRIPHWTKNGSMLPVQRQLG